MKRRMIFLAVFLSAALFCCKEGEGTGTGDAGVRSAEAEAVQRCRIQWLTTAEDLGKAARLGLAPGQDGFVIGHDSLPVHPCAPVDAEGHVVLAAAEIHFSSPGLADIRLSVVRSGDTITTEVWGSVPLEDGGVVNVVSPLTCEVTMEIGVDPSFDGDL